MNKENESKFWKMIQEAGDYLLGQWNAMVHNGFTIIDTSYADNLKFIEN